MSRRNIKKIKTSPDSYGDKKRHFPRVTVRGGKRVNIQNPRTEIQSRSFSRTSRAPLDNTPT